MRKDGFYGPQVVLEGYAKVLEALQAAPGQINAALKRAARLTATQALAVAKRKVPQRVIRTRGKDGKKKPTWGSSGTLKKSLGTKVVTNRKTGKITLLIGPRRKQGRNVLDASGREVFVNPSRYAHLVEKGAKIRIYGRGRTIRTKARPFLEPARDFARNAVDDITRQVVAEALAKIENKGGK